MKRYLTTYVISRGILFGPTEKANNSDYVYFLMKKGDRVGRIFSKLGRDVHDTLEQAQVRALDMIKRKREALHRQLRALETLEAGIRAGSLGY